MQTNVSPIQTNGRSDRKSFLEDTLDLRTLFYTILENKKTIALTILFIVVLSWINLFLKAPLFQANVLLQVQDKESSTLNLLSTFSQQLTNNQSQASATDVQKVLIQSRFILDPVIDGLHLDINIKPYYFPMIGSLIANKKNPDELSKPFLGMDRYAWGGEKLVVDQFEVPHKYLKKDFTLKALDKNQYILFNPNGDKVLTGKVGELEVVTNKNHSEKYVIKVGTLQANNGTHFSIEKLPRDKIIANILNNLFISDLGKNPGAYGETGILELSYSDDDPQQMIEILNTIASVDVAQDQQYHSLEAAKTLSFLKEELPSIKSALDGAETKLNIYRAQSGTLDISEASKMLLQQITDTENQLQKMRIEKAQMGSNFTSKHPFMIMLSQRIQQSQNDLNSLELQLEKLPSKDQKAVSLMRDVKVKNFLYLLVLQKIQELQVIKAGTLSDVRILSYAEMPDYPLSKHVSLVTLASIILGLFLSILVIISRLLMDQKINDPRWSEQHLDLVTLSIVPFSKKQKAIMSDDSSLLHLLAKANPSDISIEALRSLRTSLQFLLLESTKNIICITGASPSIGKSFIAANFAYVLADSGKKILLIDADLRRGHLYKYFDGIKKPGLSELISGKAEPKEIISETFHENLKILRAGTYPPNPSELLMSDKFKNLLDKFSQEYDLVIIDTAPVLAATDGVLVAALSGISLFVIGSATHQASELDLAIKKLQNNGIKIHGTVFNHLKEESKSQLAYYGKYNYSYEEASS